jgi:hypothetical protein
VRRSVLLGAIVAALVPAGVGVATTPPDTTVPGGAAAPPTEPAEVAGTEPAAVATTAPEGAAAIETTAAGEAAEPAVIYDEEGNEVATVTVVGVETGWSDYEEGNEPDEGNEYVRVTVEVESTAAEDSFGISVGDFILQSNTGRVTSAENIRTAAQAEADEEVPEETELATGGTTELTLTFQVASAAGPQSVLYRPDDDTLIDIAELG